MVQEDLRTSRQMASEMLSAEQAQLRSDMEAVQQLRTEAIKTGHLLGFGRRVVVPSGEIHVVRHRGIHVLASTKETEVFGASGTGTMYFANTATQIIPLSAGVFKVVINEVEALDKNRVTVRVWSEATAQLDPEQAIIAADRVGKTPEKIVGTITTIGSAALINASSKMSVEEMIEDRNKLREMAFAEINEALKELGYNLSILSIAKLGGTAYQKIVEQNEALVLKDSTIVINRHQLAQKQDEDERARREAEIKAETDKKTSAEELDAQQEIETATMDQQEALRVRENELALLGINRSRTVAASQNELDLEQEMLGRNLNEQEAQNEADLNELRQKRDATLRRQQTELEAERLLIEQAKRLEREQAEVDEQAKIKEAEETARANRSKDIAEIEAEQRANTIKVEAGAKADALATETEAQTEANLRTARAEAEATKLVAEAALVEADATRAKTSAAGLAEAEVAAQMAQVALEEAKAIEASGLAEAAVTREKELASLAALTEQARLYAESPELLELERYKLELAQTREIQLAQIQAQQTIATAFAQNANLRIIGSPGQMGQIMSQIMTASAGLNALGEEVPMLGSMLNGSGSQVNIGSTLARILPIVKEVLNGVDPYVLTSLKLNEVIERIIPALEGETDLVSTIQGVRDDANFRLLGNIPIAPFLKLFGITLPENADEETTVVSS